MSSDDRQVRGEGKRQTPRQTEERSEEMAVEIGEATF